MINLTYCQQMQQRIEHDRRVTYYNIKYNKTLIWSTLNIIPSLN